MAKRGKAYLAVAEKVEKGRAYKPEEAVRLVKELARARFDETVELHLRTNADPRRQDQMMRGVIQLPHGTGKKVRVLVFAQGDAAEIARQAGADIIGDEEVIRRIEQEGWTDFEVAIATPDMMGRIGRLGRILGRRGLMPNPRTGTVVRPEDLPRAIREAKGGRVEYRMDRSGNIHIPIGKASYPPEHLLENLAVVVDTLQRNKPEGIKGPLFRSIHLTTTMGPSIKLDLPSTLALKVE